MQRQRLYVQKRNNKDIKNILRQTSLATHITVNAIGHFNNVFEYNITLCVHAAY